MIRKLSKRVKSLIFLVALKILCFQSQRILFQKEEVMIYLRHTVLAVLAMLWLLEFTAAQHVET